MEKFLLYTEGDYLDAHIVAKKVNELIDQQTKDRCYFEAAIANLTEENTHLIKRLEYLENELSIMKFNSLPDSEKYMP